MSKPTFSYGLSLSKKPTSSKPAPPRRKPVFGGDDDSDDDNAATAPRGTTSNARGGVEEVQEVGGLDASLAIRAPTAEKPRKSKSKNAPPPTKPPTLKARAAPTTMFGDLSGSLTSRRNAEEGEKVDASIYEYDAVYDSIKPQRNKKDDEEVGEDGEKKARYMTGLLAASSVRKRDQQIAEERRIAREREAEGEEFQDKEKFVTAAYRRQQEENKKAREEEERREREEMEKNKGRSGGMTDFYRNLLDRENKERAEVVKAAEEKAKQGPSDVGQEEGEKEKTEAELAKELEAKGISVAVNEDGQIVDKRQLLKGGLNVVAKKPEPKRDAGRSSQQQRDQAGWSRGQGGRGFVGAGGGKRAMVERQSRMLEEQLSETLKRSRQAEEEEQQRTIEKMSKSTKSEKDVSSARERYLARKREAEEAKKKGLVP